MPLHKQKSIRLSCKRADVQKNLHAFSGKTVCNNHPKVRRQSEPHNCEGPLELQSAFHVAKLLVEICRDTSFFWESQPHLVGNVSHHSASFSYLMFYKLSMDWKLEGKCHVQCINEGENGPIFYFCFKITLCQTTFVFLSSAWLKASNASRQVTHAIFSQI